MQIEKQNRYTVLNQSIASEKLQRDIKYLMSLKTENLLFPYYFEACLAGRLNYRLEESHGGWDNPLSNLRGTFTGHWLSAAAQIYATTQHQELKTKADYIVSEIGRCQDENGGEWAFPIPEKYLYYIKSGRNIWAPQYVCHKVMMGLLDMYLYAHNEKALHIVKKCANWFYKFTNDITRENMDQMMKIEETGAMMEFFADLYAITQNAKHLELMRRYERPELFDPVLDGKDVLTNMHANATIPEIHGCARAYEVTGEERYRKIVENYWNLAVDKRGTFATGGQTCGEIWTPIGIQSSRLSELNQEHCVVYNMIRLADYLYRCTGDVKYADYIELNTINGLWAQGFWESRIFDQRMEKGPVDEGIVTYYLPLAAGSQKRWGSKTEEFWCCHCTVVQANAKYHDYIYYKQGTDIIINQYLPSRLETLIDHQKLIINQTAPTYGEFLGISEVTTNIQTKPNHVHTVLNIECENTILATLKIRKPWWIDGKAIIKVNNSEVDYQIINDYIVLEREWLSEKVDVILPKKIKIVPLLDELETVAFLDGPVLLAGLVGEERILYGNPLEPETILKPHAERQWGDWQTTYRTINQDVGFYFKPLYEIGKEIYTIYFPIRQKSNRNSAYTSIMS